MSDAFVLHVGCRRCDNGGMDVDLCVRISDDQTGDAHGVENQIAECRQYAAQRGWTVVDVYRDDSVSATKGARRAGFEGMLARPVKRPVVMWNLDRALRLSRDLERVIEQDLTIYGVQTGVLRLDTPAGRAVARTITAWSTYEGEIKAERQVLANKYLAAAGKPLWRVGPYGHDTQGRLVPEEAQNVREAAQMILDGHSVRSVTAWLAERGGPKTNLNRFLQAPRLAGHNIYRGERMSKSLIEPILSEEMYSDLVALLSDTSRRTSGSRTGKVQYLLTGLATCGVCGLKMVSGVDKYGRKIYRCDSRIHNAHPMFPVETEVVRRVFEVLGSDDAPAIIQRHTMAPSSDRQRLRDLRDRLAEWEAHSAEMRPGEYMNVTRPIRTEIAEIEEQMRRESHYSVFEGLGVQPDMTVRQWYDARKAMADRWRDLPLLKQREIVSTLFDIRLDKRPITGPKKRLFKPESIRITLR